MFQIYPGDYVNISPIKPEKRGTESSTVQTETEETEEKFTQAPLKHHVQAQTDPSLDVKKRVSSIEFDPDTLAAFLNRVTPKICEFLTRNAEYDPFHRYKLVLDQLESSSVVVHTLQNKVEGKEFRCSDISWNCNGSVIAVSYSVKSSHSDWCEHDTVIALWNIHRNNFDPEKPHTKIETDNCISRIEFHPQHPALLAGAKYNGQIFVWNVAEDDVVMASSESVFNAHREPITGLFWSTENSDQIISCSLDGKILVWQYNAKQDSLELRDGFIVLAANLAKGLKIESFRPDAEVGVTSMSINYEDPSIFMIGTEGGGIFQCTFKSLVPVPTFEINSIPLKSPITVVFEKHNGHVTSIHCSPHARNIFLSSSNDGEIRIYNIYQTKPIWKIHTMTGIEKVRWSVSRPMVFAAVSDTDGQLLIFDLEVSKVKHVESLPLAEEKTDGTALVFSHKDKAFLCTGSSNGIVQMWSLSSSLITQQCYELENFKGFTKFE